MLREVQKVYVRREEESQKRQARILVTAVRESKTVAKLKKKNLQRQGDSCQRVLREVLSVSIKEGLQKENDR